MALTGQAKRDYQRGYMRSYRSNKKADTRSNVRPTLEPKKKLQQVTECDCEFCKQGIRASTPIEAFTGYDADGNEIPEY